MSRREERLARNEAFFRELNERLEAATPDSAEELVAQIRIDVALVRELDPMARYQRSLAW